MYDMGPNRRKTVAHSHNLTTFYHLVEIPYVSDFLLFGPIPFMGSFSTSIRYGSVHYHWWQVTALQKVKISIESPTEKVQTGDLYEPLTLVS